MKAFLTLALLTVTASAAVPKIKDAPQITEAELLRRTQLLYDSLPAGNQQPWKQFYADDALFFDEKGRSMDKPALIADVTPMPTGYSGSIKVDHTRTLFAPNVVIFTYDAEETETIFTNEMHARYHTTDTWLYRNHLWQIAASQTLRYYEDPATGFISTALLNDYLGTYEMAPGNQLTVTRKGDILYTQRGTAAPVQLLPESPDLFFRAGVEGRRFFHRNAAGKVDLLIDRRNNEDILWKKIS